ncbi:MAG: SWIM zinc finger family protein [Candidatus Limnocylindrales bacterium]
MPFRRRSTSFGRNRGFYPPPSTPRPVKDGLQTKSRRGAIGATWWSRRFIDVLEDFHDGPRLARGRAYARRGQVIDMEVEAGEVSARVQGSRARPYDISISVAVLDDTEWARIEEAMASRAVFLARLLAGEMPNEIEEAFAATGLSLFPASADDLESDCSCPDWENPCKHIAAVYYLLAEAFDRDPFLMLAWRGRPRERLLSQLRALRGQAADPAGGAVGEPETVLPELTSWLVGFLDPAGVAPGDGPADTMASRFWEAGGDFTSARVEPRSVTMPEAILRELRPSGLSVGGRPLEDLLTPTYRAIAAAAVRLADTGSLDEAPPN